MGARPQGGAGGASRDLSRLFRDLHFSLCGRAPPSILRFWRCGSRAVAALREGHDGVVNDQFAGWRTIWVLKPPFSISAGRVV